jgi:glycosyltransferase involved in cell wall biosynthesis
MPRISVVTPLYNRPDLVPRTIESVIRQTFTDWEYVVVDDGSTDDSAAVVARIAATEPRLRLIRQPNGHLCNARNNGFAACSPDSEYLLFLDSDDLLEPEYLQVMIEHLDAHKEVGVAYCCYKTIDSNDVLYPSDQWMVPHRYLPSGLGYKAIAPSEPETPFFALMAYQQAAPSFTLFRRSVYEKTGGWVEETGRKLLDRGYEDKDLVLRCALLAPVHLINRHLVRYRLHEENTADIRHPRWHKHYEARWRTGDFLPPEQRIIARRGLAFERFVSGCFKFKWVGEDLKDRQVGMAITHILQGVKNLAISALMRLPA